MAPRTKTAFDEEADTLIISAGEVGPDSCNPGLLTSPALRRDREGRQAWWYNSVLGWLHLDPRHRRVASARHHRRSREGPRALGCSHRI
jgi:hypothetical protein